MDRGEKPENQPVNKSKEGWNDQKKSGAFVLASKKARLIRLSDRRNARAGERYSEGILELVNTMVSRYEASQGTREIRANHRSVTGWVAGQGAHDPVPFESTLERDFVYLALFERYVSKVQAQPLTLTWKDDHGISRHYTPDFLVEYSTPGVATHRAIVEVKFTDDLNGNWTKLEPGFRAMEAWCAENRHHFYVATEKEIRAQRIQNVRAVFPFRFNGKLISRQVNDEIFREIRRRTPISIGTLLEMAGDDREHRAAIQASIWGLLSVGIIWVDLDEPLGPQSVIHLEAPPQTQLFFTKRLMR